MGRAEERHHRHAAGRGQVRHRGVRADVERRAAQQRASWLKSSRPDASIMRRVAPASRHLRDAGRSRAPAHAGQHHLPAASISAGTSVAEVLHRPLLEAQQRRRMHHHVARMQLRARPAGRRGRPAARTTAAAARSAGCGQGASSASFSTTTCVSSPLTTSAWSSRPLPPVGRRRPAEAGSARARRTSRTGAPGRCAG